MSRQGGTCRVLMPRHVPGEGFRVLLPSATPVPGGTAITRQPFSDGINLTMRVVRGEIEEACRDTLEDLTPPRGSQLGALVRLEPWGIVEALPMRTLRRNYLTLEAETLESRNEVTQQISGATLYQDDSPVGWPSKGSVAVNFSSASARPLR